MCFLFSHSSLNTLKIKYDLLESDKKLLRYSRLKAIESAELILRKIELKFLKIPKQIHQATLNFFAILFLIIITILIITI